METFNENKNKFKNKIVKIKWTEPNENVTCVMVCVGGFSIML